MKKLLLTAMLAALLVMPLEGAALALDLKCKGDLTGGTGAFSCSIQDLFALELSTTTTIKTVITLPSLTLPAGAVVEDLGI